MWRYESIDVLVTYRLCLLMAWYGHKSQWQLGQCSKMIIKLLNKPQFVVFTHLTSINQIGK